MKKVQVLGPGCPKCQQVAANVAEAATAVGVEVEIEKTSRSFVVPRAARVDVRTHRAHGRDGVVRTRRPLRRRVARLPRSIRVHRRRLLRAGRPTVDQYGRDGNEADGTEPSARSRPGKEARNPDSSSHGTVPP